VILVSGVDRRTVDTALRLGEILNLNMDGALQKPVLIDALRGKLSKSRDARAVIDVDDLRDAIHGNQIQPIYQPKIVRDADGQWRICEVETLARWLRDDAVTILPSEFIEIAEQSGLLPQLTRSLLEQVIAQLTDWDARGLKLTAAVNVSPSVLSDETFPDQLEVLMQKHGLDNSRLILELTETAVMRNAQLAMEVLSRARVKGFGLAIDDFGTGYSSIEQLYRMPFNELKIDRFLVRDIGKRLEAADVVEAIVALGHKLKLSVCAEGVESQHALSFLLEAGCDKFQGFYVGRPVSARALEQRARDFEAKGFDSLGWQSDTPQSESHSADGKGSLTLLCL